MIIDLKESTVNGMTFEVSEGDSVKKVIVSGREFRINGAERLIELIKTKFARENPNDIIQ